MGFVCIGCLFVMEYYGVVVDLMIMVKGLGGGLLISVVIGWVEVMDSFGLGGFGGIYVGNLLVVVVVYVVFDVIVDEDLCVWVIWLG